MSVSGNVGTEAYLPKNTAPLRMTQLHSVVCIYEIFEGEMNAWKDRIATSTSNLTKIIGSLKQYAKQRSQRRPLRKPARNNHTDAAREFKNVCIFLRRRSQTRFKFLKPCSDIVGNLCGVKCFLADQIDILNGFNNELRSHILPVPFYFCGISSGDFCFTRKP